jgi:hypothetical protein
MKPDTSTNMEGVITKQELIAARKKEAVDYVKANGLKWLQWRPDVNKFQVYVLVSVPNSRRVRCSLGYVLFEDAKTGSLFGDKFKKLTLILRDEFPYEGSDTFLKNMLAVKEKIKRELKFVLKY